MGKVCDRAYLPLKSQVCFLFINSYRLVFDKFPSFRDWSKSMGGGGGAEHIGGGS